MMVLETCLAFVKKPFRNPGLDNEINLIATNRMWTRNVGGARIRHWAERHIHLAMEATINQTKQNVHVYVHWKNITFFAYRYHRLLTLALVINKLGLLLVIVIKNYNAPSLNWVDSKKQSVIYNMLHHNTIENWSKE